MTTGAPPPGAPMYEGSQVQIGGGFGGMKPLAQSGKVLIVDGELILYGTKGQVIDRAPVAAVSAKKTWYTLNSVIVVRLGGGRKYSLAIKAGGAMLFTGPARLATGNSAGKHFLAVLKEEQQRRGPA
jgi:hypothetical protein